MASNEVDKCVNGEMVWVWMDAVVAWETEENYGKRQSGS